MPHGSSESPSRHRALSFHRKDYFLNPRKEKELWSCVCFLTPRVAEPGFTTFQLRRAASRPEAL